MIDNSQNLQMDKPKSDKILERVRKIRNDLENDGIEPDSSFTYTFHKIWYFFNRQTSPLHRRDAKEKYWILWRELEAAMHSRAIDMDFISFTGFKDKKPQEIDHKFLDFLEFLAENPHTKIRDIKIFLNLLLYAKILSKQKLGMLNNAEVLNLMWRDITFVRSRLLTDGIIVDERLPAQLEYCRLECTKICTDKNAGLEEMCHETALELDEAKNTTAPENSSNNQKSRRNIAFILAKLNNIRLNDINNQLRIKKTYNVAFAFLSILSLLLLTLNEVLTETSVNYSFAAKDFMNTISVIDPISWFLAAYYYIAYMLKHNLLAFIFFAGLLGGFFSTVMRLRSKQVNIGDVYLKSYLLTKPIVGALGATILYIILKSNIVAINLEEIKVINKVQEFWTMHGPVGFAFGFIMGFSERIIFPTIKPENQA